MSEVRITRELTKKVELSAETGDVHQMYQLLGSWKHVINQSVDLCGNTALMIAARHGRIEIARLLITNGARVNVFSEFGNTALTWAAYKGDTNVAQLLIENGANVNAVRPDGETALAHAVYTNNIDMVRFLLANGAIIDTQALEWSAAHPKIAKIFRDARSEL